MTRMRAIVVMGAAVSLLGGCAPSFGVGVANGPCARPGFQAGMRRANVNLVQKNVARIQSRFTAGARFTRANPENWKQLASGECR